MSSVENIEAILETVAELSSTLSGNSLVPTTIEIKTQKALGLKALRYLALPLSVPTYHVCSAKEPTVSLVGEGKRPVFARPCPMVPRHGFVDSRVVSTEEELTALAAEVLEEDPEGEIILMRPLEAEVSAVATPWTISVGAGTDGATAGQSDTIHLPAPLFQLNPEHRKAAGLKPKDTPYLEIVGGWAVQLRAGPKVPKTQNYIPKKVEVKKIIKPQDFDNLLKWEEAVQSAEPGTVALGCGQSLASHYAVHCVVNEVPFIAGNSVSVGDILTPSSKTPNMGQLGPEELSLLKEELVATEAGVNGLSCESGSLGVAVCHLLPTMQPNSLTIKLLARGLVFSSYHLLAACLTEMRYCRDRAAPSSDSEAETVVKIYQGCGDSSRSSVYGECSEKPLKSLLSAAETIHPLWFKGVKWDGGQIGGEAWGSISTHSIELAQATVRLMEDPTPETLKTALGALNDALHALHNGEATAISKWGVNMDEVGKNPGKVILAQLEQLWADCPPANRPVPPEFEEVISCEGSLTGTAPKVWLVTSTGAVWLADTTGGDFVKLIAAGRAEAGATVPGVGEIAHWDEIPDKVPAVIGHQHLAFVLGTELPRKRRSVVNISGSGVSFSLRMGE